MAGTLYLGGLRLEEPAAEPFLLQKDWLNFDPATEAPLLPAAGSRIDLVWIEAWRQPADPGSISALRQTNVASPRGCTGIAAHSAGCRRTRPATARTCRGPANQIAATDTALQAAAIQNAEE